MHIISQHNFTTWWPWTVQRTLASQGTLVFIDKWMKNWTFIQTTGRHLGTLCRGTRNTLGPLQVVSFLVFCMLGARNRQKIQPSELWCHFQCTHAHPVTSLAWKWCYLVVGHTPSYTVYKFGVNQINGSRDTAIFVSPPPVAVQTHCQNVNLLICFTRYATHGLPGASSCTTPYKQLGCQGPDVRVLPIQVPAWDLDQNLQD